ncbi:MAG: hypothetical protein HKN11_14460 [Rhizobiales bacterium]|nr:hypothetical protein [Hyphomicrobiales bacterium]
MCEFDEKHAAKSGPGKLFRWGFSSMDEDRIEPGIKSPAETIAGQTSGKAAAE